MLRVLANDHDMAVTLDYLALVADFLYGRLYFQSFYHLSEICASALFAAPGDSALRRIVDRNLDRYLIARNYFYIVHTHFTGNMRCYYVSVCKLYFEHGVGQYFSYDALAFDYVGFSQNNSSFVKASVRCFRSTRLLLHE